MATGEILAVFIAVAILVVVMHFAQVFETFWYCVKHWKEWKD